MTLVESNLSKITFYNIFSKVFTSNSNMSYLSDSTYGKDNVKFLKVKKDPRNPKIHEVMEATVRVLLTGAFDESYTEADNSSIVPTDTVKNTILVEAKKFDIWPIENFAAHLAKHFINKYSWVSAVDVSIHQHRWTRISRENGASKTYDHSFLKDGDELRLSTLQYSRNGTFKLSSGVKDLTVLKSTGSMFYGYNECDYTTLKPTKDRILSTDVDATWVWDSKKLGSINNINTLAKHGVFDDAFEAARKVTLDLFATENSPSVQNTMYKMAQKILDLVPDLENVTYSLPNKHYFLFDFSFQGLENDNELFYPSPHPNGLIKCTVARTPKSKL